MVLVLITQHNVHQMHIIQVLLIMVLMVFEERGGKYDLIIILRELCGIVPLQHKIQHDLMKYEIVIYNVHVVMHVLQLNLILFEGNIEYDVKVLKMGKTIPLLYIITGEFWFGIKKRKEQKNNDSSSNDDNSKQQNNKMLKNGISVIPHYYVHQLHIIQVLLIMILIVFEDKGEKYNQHNLLIMIQLCNCTAAAQNTVQFNDI